jgi:hypothetical protein
MELNFGPAIDVSELAGVAMRLGRRASTLPALATRFNYQMIASIFSNWSGLIDR